MDIAGGSPAAHYVDAYTEVSGVRFPTVRRVYVRQDEGGFQPEPLVVSIDLSNIQVT